MSKQREEVLNVIIAECIYDRGVLDINQLEQDQVRLLVSIYDQIVSNELLPLSSIKDDSIRALIDDTISNVFSVPSLDGLREALSREPIICGKQL